MNNMHAFIQVHLLVVHRVDMLIYPLIHSLRGRKSSSFSLSHCASASTKEGKEAILQRPRVLKIWGGDWVGGRQQLLLAQKQ